MTGNYLSRGFTLFEILVVMAIMALVLTLVPPLLPGVISATKVKSAAREIAAGLNYARNQAITRQKETTLTMDVEGKSFQLDEREKRLNLSDETTISLITASSEQISDHKGRIRFFPDGSSTGGQVKLGWASNEFLVDVNWLTGRVRIFP